MNPFAYLDAWQGARSDVMIRFAQNRGALAYNASDRAVRRCGADGLIFWDEAQALTPVRLRSLVDIILPGILP